jgi:hypothetical protein
MDDGRPGNGDDPLPDGRDVERPNMDAHHPLGAGINNSPEQG